MTYLLDTNTCIKYLNGRSDNIRMNLESRNSEDIVLCSIVKAELFYGAMKSQNPEKTLMKLNQFIERFISLPFDDDASKNYGEIRAQLEKRGTPIGPNDLLIAATAISNSVTLITNNTREFGRVEGLKLDDWESLPIDQSNENGV